ncbi:MAG: T9SS type A sorting domain-containing protein [Ignavibacteria bacterium]
MKTKLFAFFFLFSNILISQNFDNLLINDLILDNEKIFVVGKNYDNSLQVVKVDINTNQQEIIFKKSYLFPDTVVVVGYKTLLSGDTLIIPYMLITNKQEDFILHLHKDGTVIKNNRMPFPIILSQYLNKPILITYNTALKIYSYPELTLLKSPDINVDRTTLDPNSDFSKMIIYDDGKINSRIIVINNFNDSLKIFKFSNKDFRLKGYYENGKIFVASSIFPNDTVYVNLYLIDSTFSILKKKEKIMKGFVVAVLKINNLYYVLVYDVFVGFSYILTINENLEEVTSRIQIAGDGYTMINNNSHIFVAVNKPRNRYSFIQKIPFFTNVEEKIEKITFQLYQNYPNPFNLSTRIKFTLPEMTKVTLKVYNILGQEVATILENKELPAGSYDYEFNAGNLTSGTYIYRLVAGNFVQTKKMVLMK